MHYAVPAILAQSGMLERLYTDICAPRLPRPLQTLAYRMGPPSVRRWFGRIPAGIPVHKITSFDAMGLEYYRRLKCAPNPEAKTAAVLWAGKELSRRVIQRGLGKAQSVYTYNSAGLELLLYARDRGLFAVSEQTSAPERIYQAILHQEQANYRRWSVSSGNNSSIPAYIEREETEWSAANMILCGSEFVRDCIRSMGAPVERCLVVPYGIRPSISVELRDRPHKPMRVLTVGAVKVMKGAPYLLAAARALKGKVEFRMVGQIDVTPYAQKLLSEHVTLLGGVPRSEIHRQFAWADVFLLPTLCEGSATVCYEALSNGLPVITTPNAGSVVRDGVDGFIVPIRDATAIADRVERLLDDDDLWTEMSANARLRAMDYSLERYGERLLQTLTDAG